MRPSTARIARSFLIPAASLGLAVGLRLAVDPALHDVQPLTTLYLAITVTAWFGGFWPALVVNLLGYVVADWFFIAPRHDIGAFHPHLANVVGFGLYFVVGTVIAGLTESLRRTERRADEKARELALRAAELQALFDAAPIGIWVAHDPDCQRITGNHFADQILGTPSGGNVSLSVPPDRRAVQMRAVKEGRALQPGELPLQVAVRTGMPVVNSAFDFVFDDGRTISLAGGAAPLRSTDGRVRGAITALQDVSAQKRAEESSAADRRTMQALHEISARFIREHDLRAAFDEILGLAVEVMGADFGSIQLLNPATDTLDVHAQRGFEREFLDFLAERALRTRTRTIVEDVGMDPLLQEPRMQAVMRTAGVRAVQSTPLFNLSGELLGTLSTHHRAPHRPGPQQLRHLDILARQTADLIEYVRGEERRTALLQSTERAREEAERAAATLGRVQQITDAMLGDLPPDDLLREVLGRVQKALEADLAVLLVGKVEKDGELVLRVRAIVGGPNVETGSVARRRGFGDSVAREGRAKIWNDIDPGQMMFARALAGVPLSLGEQLVGVLEVASLRPRHFTDDDLNLLRLAGERIALAIERATRQDADRQIRESLEASNRVKDEFLAMLGHELRNPLAAVRNAVAIASLDASRGPRALEIARRQVDQLGRLIDDLLDVARITQGRIVLRKERVSLREIIERAVESVRALVEERGVQLTVADTPAAIHVEADPARLEQVFVNLLSNSAKYTDAGGRIDLTSEWQGSEAVVHVRDTGIGIAPEMLPRIWELFAQGDRTLDRADGGLGIGLTVVRRLVELHGGRIEAHSEGLGRGAEFVVRLGAAPLAAEGSPSTTPQPPPQRRARVLVVEDNRDTAEALKMLLEHFGHRVRVVHDGLAALGAARTSPPDVMLVDIGLPGVNGYEVARRVRDDRDLDRVSLVALTGYGREEDKEQAMAAGFDYHLVKPVNPTALRGLVAQLGGVEASESAVH